MDKAPGVDPRRLVAIFFVVVAAFLGVFLEKVIGLAFSYARVNDLPVFSDWSLSTVLGYAGAAAAGLVAWRTPRVQGISLEIAGELKKVTWPSLREARAATVAVLVFTFVTAIILGFFDYIWARLSALVY